MAINPFQQFNSPSMSLLNVGGFQDPLQPKPIGQDIVNVPQLQNQVGQLQARKNQQLGSMLLALGDIFRGQDPATGVMQRQMFLQEQADEERRKKVRDEFLKKNPGMSDLINLVDAGYPPSILASKEVNPELYQLVDEDNQFINNITEQEFLSLQKSGDLPEGVKLTRIPQGTEAAKSVSVGEVSDVFTGLETEVNANQQLQTGLDDIIKTIKETPKASLFVGDVVQFTDSVIQNIDAGTNLLSKASDNPIYKNLQEDIFVVKDEGGADITNNVKNQIKNISKGNAKLESQIKDLAYLFAAARGQEGRGLSDKDFQNALNIISGGVGPEGRIAVINDVKRRFKRDLTDKLSIKKETYQGLYDTNPDNENYKKYVDEIDVLLGLSFFEQNQISDKNSIEDILKKYE
jgi:hypothetical protein